MFHNPSAAFTSCCLATLSHICHIALFGMLLLAGGCGPLRTVVVPSDQLLTWPIQSESVQVETAEPFVEQIELSMATLQFPTLRGVVAAFDAPWRNKVLLQPLSLDTRDGIGVEVLPAIPSTAEIDNAAPRTGARVRVSSAGPFPSRIELSSATLVNSRLSGVVRAVEGVPSNKVIGQSVTLDVRKLKQVVVYQADKQRKSLGAVFIGIGSGIAVLGGLCAIPGSAPIPYVGGVIAEAQVGCAIGAGLGGALAMGGLVTLLSAKWSY